MNNNKSTVANGRINSVGRKIRINEAVLVPTTTATTTIHGNNKRQCFFFVFVLIGILLQFSTTIRKDSSSSGQKYNDATEFENMPTMIRQAVSTITASSSSSSSMANIVAESLDNLVPDISELSKYMTSTYNNNNNKEEAETDQEVRKATAYYKSDASRKTQDENGDIVDVDDDDEFAGEDTDDDEEDEEDDTKEDFELFEEGNSGDGDGDDYDDGGNGNGNDNDNDNEDITAVTTNHNDNTDDEEEYNQTEAELHDPLSNLVPATTTSYRTSNNIPTWMKKYFDWHRRQIDNLNETNWNTDRYDSKQNRPIPQQQQQQTMSSSSSASTTSTIYYPKFLILRCLNTDRCGGLSDRLKPLLLFIAIAAHTQRILFIRWERPYPLEEFLLPRDINWTVPSYIHQQLVRDDPQIKPQRPNQHSNQGLKVSRAYLVGPLIQNHLRSNTNTIIETRIQLDDGGARLYQCIVYTMTHHNDHNNSTISRGRRRRSSSISATDYTHCTRNKIMNDPILTALDFTRTGPQAYRHIYHDFFTAFFQPSPPVHTLITHKMQQAGLTHNHFIGSHYRSNYGPGEADRIGEAHITAAAQAQVVCAARMRPGYPVYFAGDSTIAITAVRAAATQLATKNITIITARDETTDSDNTDTDTDNDNDNDNDNDIDNVKQQNKNTERVVSQQPQLRLAANVSSPLHIEFDKGEIADFYPAFVDLLVMGNSMCLLYGIGGFGSFASLLSYNASCSYSIQTCTGSEAHYLPHEKCCMKQLFTNNAKATRIQENRRKRKEKKLRTLGK